MTTFMGLTQGTKTTVFPSKAMCAVCRGYMDNERATNRSQIAFKGGIKINLSDHNLPSLKGYGTCMPFPTTNTAFINLYFTGNFAEYKPGLSVLSIIRVYVMFRIRSSCKRTLSVY